MKRGRPLQRKSRLVAKTGLSRTSPMRRTAVAGKRPRDTGPTKKVRDLVKRRAKHTCERCGLCPGQVVHHRDPRGIGGSSRPEVNLPSNLVYICVPCHEYVESKRLEAIGYGWLVEDRFVPAKVRIELHYGWHLLTDDGRAVPVPGPCRAGCAVWTTDKTCDCQEA